ncbi:MAG: hypothetical protein HY739_05750 [Desulfobacterales bacterium]|nr:hypothetical protein [Desulfobacterales bacterium]
MSEYRLINIMVEKLMDDEEDAFCYDIPIALREYADAVERGNNSPFSPLETVGKSDCEIFHTSNGCEIKVIAGGYNKI